MFGDPIEFNLNDYVWFKLTPHGESVWREWRRNAFLEVNRGLRSIGKPPVSDEIPSPEPDGYHRLQMHEWMEIFGGNNIGACRENCFSLTIRLDARDLMVV